MAASLADTVTYYYTPCAGVWQAHGAGQAGKIRNGPGRLNTAGRAADLADGCRLRAACSRPPCIAVSQGGWAVPAQARKGCAGAALPGGRGDPSLQCRANGRQSLPCKGRCRRRRRRGTAPCPANILPADTNLSGGRERPPYKVRQACSTAGDDKPPRASAQGPMISSARRRA